MYIKQIDLLDSTNLFVRANRPTDRSDRVSILYAKRVLYEKTIL